MITLVTGATGLVGNNVVRILLEQGHPVRVLARAPRDARPLEGLPVEVFEGDVRDAQSVHRAMAGASHVVHAAAVIHIGWRGLETQRAVNVEGTRNVARAAAAAGARMVHVSSVDALGIQPNRQPADEATPREGKPLCTYVVSKREAEQAVSEQVTQGLHGVIVNPGFMLGPWDWKPSSGRMLLEVARRFTPVAPRGGCSACDVRDVAAAIVAALLHGESGRNYILAGHNVSYLELWQLFARISGGQPPLIRGGPLMMIAAGRWGDLMGRLSGREPDINSASIQMSGLCHYYDSRLASRDLGYGTRPLEETVRDAWNWFVTHAYA